MFQLEYIINNQSNTEQVQQLSPKTHYQHNQWGLVADQGDSNMDAVQSSYKTLTLMEEISVADVVSELYVKHIYSVSFCS